MGYESSKKCKPARVAVCGNTARSPSFRTYEGRTIQRSGVLQSCPMPLVPGPRSHVPSLWSVVCPKSQVSCLRSAVEGLRSEVWGLRSEV